MLVPSLHLEKCWKHEWNLFCLVQLLHLGKYCLNVETAGSLQILYLVKKSCMRSCILFLVTRSCVRSCILWLVTWSCVRSFILCLVTWSCILRLVHIASWKCWEMLRIRVEFGRDSWEPPDLDVTAVAVQLQSQGWCWWGWWWQDVDVMCSAFTWGVPDWRKLCGLTFM